jgi:hypothetical protein
MPTRTAVVRFTPCGKAPLPVLGKVALCLATFHLSQRSLGNVVRGIRKGSGLAPRSVDVSLGHRDDTPLSPLSSLA